jgi:hypothetical protein
MDGLAAEDQRDTRQNAAYQNVPDMRLRLGIDAVQTDISAIGANKKDGPLGG